MARVVRTFAVVFPGQGAQKPGMGKEFYETCEDSRAVFDTVSEAIGRDAADLCFNSDEETLRQTENTQIALFTASLAISRALFSANKLSPNCCAGHSVGEYTALAFAGILTVADGARLVMKRGELMARGGALRKGAMAAVLGMQDAEVERICAEVSRAGRDVVTANFNSPGQVVVSGDADAVEDACVKLKEAGAKRCLPLNVSGAFHSPLMQEASEAMRIALDQVEFSLGDAPVISNVTAEPGSQEKWPELLERQLRSPVRWTQSVQAMCKRGVDLFIECGPGEVLTGLLKRIEPEAEGFALNSVEAIASARDMIL